MPPGFRVRHIINAMAVLVPLAVVMVFAQPVSGETLFGSTLKIVTVDSTVFSGQVKANYPDSMVLLIPPRQRITVPKSDIAEAYRLEQQAAAGTMIGAGIGLTAALVYYALNEDDYLEEGATANEEFSVVEDLLPLALVTTVAGGLIGNLIGRSIDAYEPVDIYGVTASLTPAGRHSPAGLRLQLTFTF